MVAKQLSDGGPDGVILGQADDKVALYGGVPAAQRAGAAQATSNIVTSAFSSSNAVALIEVMNTLTALGLWKGSA